MAYLPKGAWVVVADQGRAIVLENTGPAMAPDLRRIDEIAAEVAEATDRPGRMPDPGPGQRSALEEADLPRLAGERMIRDLAARLGTAARDGRFDALVIVAAPQVLGAFRAARCDAVAGRVVAELDRNLISQPLPKIADAVQRVLAA